MLSVPDDVNHPLDVAHNTWLELSSELGVVGLLAFVGLLATAGAVGWSVTVAAWRRAQRRRAGTGTIDGTPRR